MLFDWNTIAAPAALLDVQLSAPRTLTGEGLWVCLASSGRCTASLPGASATPAGSVLVLPPQSAAAGHLILSRAPLTLTPEDSCHLLCVQLTGQASVQFLNGLRELPYLAKGETCPAAAELMGRLAEEKPTHSRARSQRGQRPLRVAGGGGPQGWKDLSDEVLPWRHHPGNDRHR